MVNNYHFWYLSSCPIALGLFSIISALLVTKIAPEHLVKAFIPIDLS